MTPHSLADLQILQAKTRLVEGSLCWHWVGYVTPKGYPSLELNGRQVLAVRASYVAQFGPIPQGKRPVQSCPNPLCICPFHLQLVEETFRRPQRPGRSGGVRLRKLSNEQVREIRGSDLDPKILAEKFGVLPSHVRDVRTGRRKRAVL